VQSTRKPVTKSGGCVQNGNLDFRATGSRGVEDRAVERYESASRATKRGRKRMLRVVEVSELPCGAKRSPSSGAASFNPKFL
jgi:hypothetical protein